jgi:hypothetical protein
LVGCFIGAAYWFTASTSFANPAVTIARAMTDTFAGIRAVDVPGFLYFSGIRSWSGGDDFRLADAAPRPIQASRAQRSPTPLPPNSRTSREE